MDSDGYKIVNVYKPPPTQVQFCICSVFTPISKTTITAVTNDWDYDNGADIKCCLGEWASINSLALLYNVKDAASFHSGTNPDLAFTSESPNSHLSDRDVLKKFSR